LTDLTDCVLSVCEDLRSILGRSKHHRFAIFVSPELCNDVAREISKLEVDGLVLEISVDRNVANTEVSPGHFASSIYIVPSPVGGDIAEIKRKWRAKNAHRLYSTRKRGR
jgi:hypothetical protein